MPESIKTVAANRKAYHDYFVEETFEAGIELYGTDVKSIRLGACNLKDAYLVVDKGELFAKGIHVSPYEKGNIFNRDPLRPKRLLLHKREILRLFGKVAEKGLTLVPLSLYFRGSRVKVELGLCRGKKLYDKRQSDADKVAERTIERQLKGRDDDA